MQTTASLSPHPSLRLRRFEGAIAAVTLFVAGLVVGHGQLLGPVPATPSPAAPAEFAMIREAWDLLHDRYVDPAALDSVEMAEEAIRSMTVAVGDTDHTVYLDPGEAASQDAELAGTSGAPGFQVVDSARIPGTSLQFIELLDVSEGATRRMAEAVEAAEGNGATGIVLDLRGNGGGYLHEAIGLVGLFVAEGDVFQERHQDGTIDTQSVAGHTPATRLPLTVLVDEDTASAAELLAGALQDHGRATIVGTTTAGMGTILSGFELADASVLYIGETEWRTPNGRIVWRRGLTPDVVVKLDDGAKPLWAHDIEAMDPVQLAASDDDQLLRAIAIASPPEPPDTDADEDERTPDDSTITFAFLAFISIGGLIAWEALREARVSGPRYR